MNDRLPVTRPGGAPARVAPPAGHGWLEVWAPAAAHVAVAIEAPAGSTGEQRPLHRSAEAPGWWILEPPLAHGTRYRFVVDGATLPDPRSAWQPDGVDGPSVLIDHRLFAWGDAGFRAEPLASAVLYELHVGTFTDAGTYEAARHHLDHLAALGITHVELMPLATFDGHHGWGYDGVDLFAPHPAYGTPDDLKAFVDDCHAHGIAVLLDVVYNHLGPTGNHLARFGPYFTDRYGTPWGDAVNLDGPGSGPVRRFLVDNATMWLRDYHVDGLRLDAVHALIDTSARHVLEELADEVDRLATAVGRPLVLIAENDTNDPRLVRPQAAGGLGLDAHWCDDVHHAIHTVLTGERDGYYGDYAAVEGFAVIERALTQGYVYDGRYSPVRDTVVGRPVGDLRGRQLVACIQNHDQVGNRARGERLAHLTSFAAQQVAATLLLTAPFVPLLFQGEEWAATSPFPYFADHRDPDLAAAVRDGRRREFAAFGWDPAEVPDPEAAATFESARLVWEERHDGDHAATLAWYRELIRYRRATPALLDDTLGAAVVTADATARTVVVRRGPVAVLANLGAQEHRFAVAGDVVLATAPVRLDETCGVVVPATAAAVVELR